MPNNKGKLPPEVTKHWPEVFGDVEIKAVPIQYIHSVHVHFLDGKVWEIGVDPIDDTETMNIEEIENSLDAFFTEYDESISHVDFRLNTSKVVKDVKERTKTFMKKRQ